ncbi:hypothetical protein [Facilibium subflavum]|uniref:hypothetical protein n=1 Tax=Facilibium subflavum TaxID=2219058 RepID=UPI0013C34553|nr:hypothetical protein [Facilibium subflavum]
MKKLYKSLSEKDRRHFAAVTAMQKGKHGIQYCCDLFGCDPKTIRRGILELQSDFFCHQGEKEWQAAVGRAKWLTMI